MEHAEHVEHASKGNRNIALLIAIIALCLALSETLGKGAQTESIAKNVEASNLWAFFQAKTIRRTVVQSNAELAKLGIGTGIDAAAKAALQKQIDDWQKTAARYRSEPETGEGSEQLAERAKKAEEERNYPRCSANGATTPSTVKAMPVSVSSPDTHASAIMPVMMVAEASTMPIWNAAEASS